MEMKKIVIFCCVIFLFFASCSYIDVWVEPATSSIEDVVVDDTPVPVSGAYVQINKLGNTLVTWTYEGSHESDTIGPSEKQDGESWTVYAGYVETW